VHPRLCAKCVRSSASRYIKHKTIRTMGKIKDAANTAWNAVQTWTFWKELFIMTFGMAVAALAVNYFLVPGKLIVGSISGLSIVISGIFDLVGM